MAPLPVSVVCLRTNRLSARAVRRARVCMHAEPSRTPSTPLRPNCWPATSSQLRRLSSKALKAHNHNRLRAFSSAELSCELSNNARGACALQSRAPGVGGRELGRATDRVCSGSGACTCGCSLDPKVCGTECACASCVLRNPAFGVRLDQQPGRARARKRCGLRGCRRAARAARARTRRGRSMCVARGHGARARS